MRRRRDLFPFLCATLAAAPARPARAQPSSSAPPSAPLTVFAAASLQDGLRALEREWRAREGGAAPLRLSFAASSALARQIEQGAPADLFASADEAWMDYLQERGLIAAETRVGALANRLVLVAPAGRPGPEPRLAPGVDLAPLLGPGGRIATGDPAHVPAGRYARQALTWLGQWEALAPRLARADNVRAALLLVERGEAPLGIVYATDARAAGGGVRVIAEFPPESHAPIILPFALTRRAARDARARALLDALTGPEAAETWRRHGFTVRT